jgi:hypothetical protein
MSVVPTVRQPSPTVGVGTRRSANAVGDRSARVTSFCSDVGTLCLLALYVLRNTSNALVALSSHTTPVRHLDVTRRAA